MSYRHNRRQVSDEDRRALLKALGVVGTAGAVGEFTLGDIRPDVATATGGELAAMGQAIRSGLSGTLDASLIGAGMAGITESIGRLPELEAQGVPETVGTAYEELTTDAWNVHEHLVAVDFFASAEENLPPFVEEHIATTARQLVGTGSLSAVLSEAGFSEKEITGMAMLAVNNNAHLAKWKPTDAYPAEKVDDFNPADIAPLHQRATEGSLLWIEGLDWWLWQNRILLTEELLADGIWDIKAMLGGYYLVSQAAQDLAKGDIADDELAALVTAGSAISIIGQEHLAADLTRVTDEARAPQGGV